MKGILEFLNTSLPLKLYLESRLLIIVKEYKALSLEPRGCYTVEFNSLDFKANIIVC